MASETGRLHTSGGETSSRRAKPGPSEPTASSTPYGPPLTLKKRMATRGRSPISPRRRGLPPWGRGGARGGARHGGWDQRGQPLEPLVDRDVLVDDDLELAARQLADAAGAGAERDDEG